MPETKLRPEDLRAKAEALIAFTRGGPLFIAWVQAVTDTLAPAPEKVAKVETMADRIAADLKAGTFRGEQPAPPEPEKAAKAATTADRIAADLAAGTFRGVKPEPEEVTCMNCRQRVDYADQHYHREDMPHVAAYFICDKPAPPEPAESVDTAKTVAYNNELDERYGDGTLARAMELSGLSIPTTPLAVEREEERQAAGEWWRNLAQPVAVGMTEELEHVLSIAERDLRYKEECFDNSARTARDERIERLRAAIAAVREQFGKRPKLEKVRGALSWLKMQYEPGSQGYTPNATVWKMTDAALAELDAAEGKRTAGEHMSELSGEPLPHYLRDARLTANGIRAAAEIARNFRPQSACTCGGYISFHNGVPAHQPGCLVGECLEIADEINARADEIDETPDRWLAELDAAEGKDEGRG